MMVLLKLVTEDTPDAVDLILAGLFIVGCVVMGVGVYLLAHAALAGPCR